MILLVVLFAVLTAAFAAEAARLTNNLRVARLALTASERRLVPPPLPPPPTPVRAFECRREHGDLLWFPILTAKDEEKLIVGVSSGLPHCPRCVHPLRLRSGRTEEWVCSACAARHPAAAADLKATDAVLAGCLREFFARHPAYRPAPGLSAPKVARPAAA